MNPSEAALDVKRAYALLARGELATAAAVIRNVIVELGASGPKGSPQTKSLNDALRSASESNRISDKRASVSPKAAGDNNMEKVFIRKSSKGGIETRFTVAVQLYCDKHQVGWGDAMTAVTKAAPHLWMEYDRLQRALADYERSKYLSDAELFAISTFMKADRRGEAPEANLPGSHEIAELLAEVGAPTDDFDIT